MNASVVHIRVESQLSQGLVTNQHVLVLGFSIALLWSEVLAILQGQIFHDLSCSLTHAFSLPCVSTLSLLRWLCRLIFDLQVYKISILLISLMLRLLYLVLYFGLQKLFMKLRCKCFVLPRITNSIEIGALKSNFRSCLYVLKAGMLLIIKTHCFLSALLVAFLLLGLQLFLYLQNRNLVHFLI